jgi:hypothetical protein
MANEHAKIGTQVEMTEDNVWEIAKRVLACVGGLRRRMNKKKWSKGIDLHTLSGVEWLRLLTGETNLAGLVGWCARCRSGTCREDTCPRCGMELLIFDEQFWSQIGHKIRRALQKDRTLLFRVKSDRENLYGTKHKPIFPASLEWLLKLWEQTSRPPHQPFKPRVHYLVANWIASLRQLGLSKEEIIEVLNKDDFPNGQFERQGKDYAKIPGEELRKLGETFRQVVGDVPSSVRDLSEMWRTMQWVDRQRSVPMARLRGERVRKRDRAED